MIVRAMPFAFAMKCIPGLRRDQLYCIDLDHAGAGAFGHCAGSRPARGVDLPKLKCVR
jgi:hypothetical protein